MERIILNRLNPYALALVIVLIATTVRLLFTPWISSQVPFLTYYVAVLIASWLGGLGPGLMAAAVCTLVANYLFLSPHYQLVPDSGTLLALSVFVLEAAAIAMISERWKVTTSALRTREAELQQSLEALRRSEEEFRTISNAAPALVWVCDPDARNVFVNDSWCKYTGQTREQAAGTGWMERLHPADRAALLPLGARCPTTDDSYEGECRYLSKGGYYQWHAFRALPRVNAHGRAEAWYGVSIDITAHKQAELQLQRWTSELEEAVACRTEALMQSQERLRALATELTLTEQRERMQLASELHDHLGQMLVLGRLKLRQARHEELTRRTSDLLHETDEALSESLAYTRTLVADLTPPVLHELGLSAALHWLSDHMRRHDLTVTVEVDEDQDYTLPEDRAILLFQSARELLINVAKHAQSSSAMLRLARNEDVLRLDVRDNGTGFNITEASDQAPSPSSKFGLFSIRERMKALGGAFELETAVGHGTRATLVLPVPASSKPFVPQDSHGAMPGGLLSNHQQCSTTYPAKPGVSRVLLVDDHAMVRQGLRSVLESYADIEVVGEAGDGEEALESVGKVHPSIVVMDINMPRMNGIEATRSIKARYPHVMVIGLSVNLDGNNQTLMRKAGADVFLSKEAAVDQLYSAIQRTVKGAVSV